MPAPVLGLVATAAVCCRHRVVRVVRADQSVQGSHLHYRECRALQVLQAFLEVQEPQVFPWLRAIQVVQDIRANLGC